MSARQPTIRRAIAAGVLLGVALSTAFVASRKPWAREDQGYAYVGGPNLSLPCAGGPNRDSTARPPTADDRKVMIHLQGQPFPAWKLYGPVGAEKDDDGAAAALRASIKLGHLDEGGIEPVPTKGWTRLYTTGRDAEFATTDGSPGWVSIQVERTSDGWEFAGSGYGQTPYVVRNGAEGLDWCLDRDAPALTAESRSISVVAEGPVCGGQSPAPQLDPEVRYATDAIVLTAFRRRLTGRSRVKGRCDLREEVLRGTVRLREPLGERLLLDGRLYPPGSRLGP